MTAKRFALAYAAAAVAFIALDFCWLSVMADRLYRPALGPLMLQRFELPPAIAFYALYIAGIVVFAVRPALPRRDWRSALGHGAMFGLVAYATYDLTNQATLKGWPWQVTVADLAWGTFVTAAAAVAATLVVTSRRASP